MVALGEERRLKPRLTLGAPIAVCAALLIFAFGAAPAKAAFGIARWETVTCDTDATPADPCIASDPPARFYTQAAGHPPFGIPDFTLRSTGGVPDDNVKDVIVELPEGLGVNPEATVKCTEAQLDASTCPAGSQVGVNWLTALVGPPPAVTLPLPVYNVEPPFGVPAQAGFKVPLPGTAPTLLVGSLDPVDQHISFTISDIEAPPAGPAVIGSRQIFNGQAGDGYLTMPSNCAGGQIANLRVDSHQNPGDFASASFTTPYSATDCDRVPFDPGVRVASGGQTDSPEPSSIELTLPYTPNPTGISQSHLLTARVTLPEGAGLNPSLANGLTPCTDAQFGKGTNDPIACPGESRIGSVEVQTPSLPPNSVGGDVYVGAPLSNDPSSGDQFRIFIHASSPRYGVNVRLLGRVLPNLETGQLTAVVANNPQAPFTSFRINLDGGARGALTSPATCGPHTATTDLTPWSANGNATPSDQFSLSSAPGGGPCPQSLGERPFSPNYEAGPTGSTAGAYSPFELHVTRPDGAQELRRIDVMLPPGMIARLAGMEYCPEANIAAAANRSGIATLTEPACPNSSFAGTVDIDAGSGPAPLHVKGNAYLAGPYKGAPVSLAFITGAVGGPYDLGTVVVRTPLYVDPETAQVHAVSDPIPYVFGGVKLDVRRVDVSLWRKKFTVNPTTCRRPFLVSSSIFGGGSDPADPATWLASAQASRFQATKCRALRFKPKFFTRLTGPTKRAGHPKLRAIYKTRRGDANLRRAAFVLPKATILDQGNIQTICTRDQLAARRCPKRAIYGYARARSPLLDGILKGPVYLVASDDLLPNLLADLRGQVNVRLRGEIIGVKGRLKTVFSPTPDVAVRKFILNMRGGDRGLLVNSDGLCKRKRFAFLNLRAQNMRRMKVRGLRLNIPACRKKKQ